MNPLTVSTATLSAREAWHQALEHRYCTISLGAVRCRLCGARFGLACAPALIAQHLDLAHAVTNLDA